MPIQKTVLIIDGSDGPRTALVQRVRELGFRALRAKTPEEAFGIVEEHRHLVAAALIPPDLPVANLSAALGALAARAPGGSLCYIVVGSRPDPEGIAALRETPAELALWEPFPDAWLRFQVNRALAGRIDERRRDDLRAPLDLPVVIRHASRQKSGRLYTLSESGAYIETQRAAMRGARITLELPIGPAPLVLEALVVYTNVPGNLHRITVPYGMGVSFVDADERVLGDIRRQVAALALELAI